MFLKMPLQTLENVLNHSAVDGRRKHAAEGV